MVLSVGKVWAMYPLSKTTSLLVRAESSWGKLQIEIGEEKKE